MKFSRSLPALCLLFGPCWLKMPSKESQWPMPHFAYITTPSSSSQSVNPDAFSAAICYSHMGEELGVLEEKASNFRVTELNSSSRAQTCNLCFERSLYTIRDLTQNNGRRVWSHLKAKVLQNLCILLLFLLQWIKAGNPTGNSIAKSPSSTAVEKHNKLSATHI